MWQVVSAASHFNMSVLCAWKRGIFPGSLTASWVLISQRIGSLDTHGRQRAFKQSSPPTKKKEKRKNTSASQNGTRLPITGPPPDCLPRHSHIVSVSRFSHTPFFASITCWRWKEKKRKRMCSTSLFLFFPPNLKRTCGIKQSHFIKCSHRLSHK